MKKNISAQGSFKEQPYCRLILTVLILLTMFVAMAASGAKKSSPVEIEADDLKVDSKNRSAVFKGNVRAKISNMVFSCDQMNIKYTEDGGLDYLKATGKVSVKREDVIVNAAQAVLKDGGNSLVLTGKPVMIRGKNRLEGKIMTMNLKTGNIDIKSARGVFVLGENTK